MILDLPPHIEQTIIAKAQAQGISPAELLTKDYGDDMDLLADQAGIITDTDNMVLTDEAWQFVMNILDNPPPLSATAKAFLRGEYV